MQTTTPSTLSEFMENLAYNHPEQVISTFKDEINVFTVQELNHKSNLLAKGLLYQGVSKGTNVALVLSGTTNCLTFALALARIGAIMIPVNPKLDLILLKKVLREQHIHTIAFYANTFLTNFKKVIPNFTNNERGYLSLKDFPELKNIVTLGSLKNRGIFTTRELMLLGSHMDDIEMENALMTVEPSDVFIRILTFGDKLKIKVKEYTHEQILTDNFTFPALQNFILNSV